MTVQHIVHCEDVQMRYPLPDGGEKLVLNDIDLKVREGEFLTVVGPTGCGKSTLLRLVLGAEHPTSGTVRVGGTVPERPNRNCGIVYQRYSLFPHLSVIENIMFGLEVERFRSWQQPIRKLHRSACRRFRDEAMAQIAHVGLAADDAKKYPHQLSGGMRQRVAIAQATIMKPRLLLMDEPFGALDHSTREHMQAFILGLWSQTQMTIFFVTHDLEEALFLGTRIIALSQYYSTDNPKSEGAKIVVDIKTPGTHPKSTRVKYAEEFTKQLELIRLSALRPDHRQHISEFDLEHPDAWRTVSEDELHKGVPNHE